jgi:hypothetical protein
MEGAHNVLLDIEELTESDLEQIKARYVRLAREASQALTEGFKDTGTPQMSAEP